MKIFVQTLVIGALAATAFTVSPAIAADTDNTKTEPKKISDRRHPNYVRCRSEPIIGSRVKKRRVCMTNKEWAQYTDGASRDTERFIEDARPGFLKEDPN